MVQPGSCTVQLGPLARLARPMPPGYDLDGQRVTAPSPSGTKTATSARWVAPAASRPCQ